MNMKLLGELTPDPSVKEWLVSGEIAVPYFPDTPLQFVLEDFAGDPAPAEFATAVKNFLSLTAEDRTQATPYVFQNYTDFLEAVDEGDVEVDIATPADVWKHVQPTMIYVLRHYGGDKKVYVRVTAECDWEQEHGLQFVYREGRQLSRVSDQDGHLTYSDAFGLPESEDRIC